MNIRGLEVELHPPGDMFSDAIRRDGDFYEPNILDYIRDTHPVHETILDVGANIGLHSLYFTQFLEYSSIYMFEPIPENYLLLIKNLTGRGKNMSFLNYAAADKKGTVRMQPNRTNMGASMITEDGELEVSTMTIDSLYLTDVTLMKIDTEYSEPAVIEGAQDTIAICKPLILIEDVGNQYAALLPDYELERGWDEHNTYLYKWRDY